MSDSIYRHEAIKTITSYNGVVDKSVAKRLLLQMPSADVVPYSVSSDGTLTITIPKGIKVGRVLVEEDGTHLGGLYYAD